MKASRKPLLTSVGLLFGLASVSLPTIVGAQETPRARIEGVVFDSTTFNPMRRTTVQVAPVSDLGEARTTLTDSLGRFRFDSLPPGSWLLAAIHPRFDSLGIEQLTRQVSVGRRGTTRVQLSTPTTRVLFAKICGTQSSTDTSGFLVGRLRQAESGRTPVRGRVRAQWIEYMLSASGVRTHMMGTEATTDDAGHFVVCGTPTTGMVRLAAWRTNVADQLPLDSSGVIDQEVPAGGLWRRDLYVGSASAVPVQITTPSPVDSQSPTHVDTSTITVARGSAGLRGTVRSTAGTPLADVRMTVRGSGIEVRTRADGGFVLNGLPSGTYELEGRAIGYDPLRVPVDLFPATEDSPGNAGQHFSMYRASSLDTMRIRAMRARIFNPKLTGFESRRAEKIGMYRGPEDIEQLRPVWLGDVFAGMPGVRVILGTRGDEIYQMRAYDSGWCAPRVWVDNVLYPNDGTLGLWVASSQVIAIEVYPVTGMRPPQYRDQVCGSIVIWTGDRWKMFEKR
ncbi:MAG TPA: carboxypeptidase-like regulatory domain-containing protein [Gemmatimonas sp.]|uniref:carboxypeptidase-like regulatory domain-containing protein n=1 Tax=Gemmatimonas sp. TaxID=1962908 RepID=UPI002ED959C7